ncbi:hypothetical protein C8Q78DRAFT_1077005 [Trametes maxima]|nr:hypothetical protein C8Q78DRAFT_1077005 [Trametes maxima]
MTDLQGDESQANVQPEEMSEREKSEWAIIYLRRHEYVHQLPSLPISYTEKILKILNDSIRTNKKPVPKLHYGFFMTPEEMMRITRHEDKAVLDGDMLARHLNNKLKGLRRANASALSVPLFTVEHTILGDLQSKVFALFTTPRRVINPNALHLERYDECVKLFKEVITDQREAMWHFHETYGPGWHDWREFDPARVLGPLASLVAEYEAERAAQAIPPR